MLSRTQVINNGLRSIAANLIADPNEESESARQAAACYDQIIRSELSAHPWYFAKTQASLPANVQAPLFKYMLAYTFPADFLRLVELEDKWVFDIIRNVDTNPIPQYEMQGRTLLTDFTAPLNITYIMDVTADPTIWAATFADVASAALAVALAMPLTKSEGMVSLAEKLYQKALRRAFRSNAIQMPPAQPPDGSWMAARIS